MLKVPDFIVSPDWLHEHLNTKNLVILEATIPKVAASRLEDKPVNEVIPGTIFFDIKGTFSASNTSFPNTMLSSTEFEIEVQKLGINQESCVVVYDSHGIYSSPRAWWMFISMGFNNIAVLNGGLPAWKESRFNVIHSYKKSSISGNFKSSPVVHSFVDFSHVQDCISKEEISVLDARSLGRFNGTSPEPRDGVRSGHIPSSKSFPYTLILENNKLKNIKELETSFSKLAAKHETLVFSCGTGITACVLALGAALVGYKNISVYDGSWTEWGSLLDLPIEL